MKEDLKPCPFCGRNPKIIFGWDKFSEKLKYHVWCNCGAMTMKSKTEKQVIAAWNKRVTEVKE
jgi:Lar family restriction alleviation protein